MSDTPLVGVIMGSDSDWPTMQAAADALKGAQDHLDRAKKLAKDRR